MKSHAVLLSAIALSATAPLALAAIVGRHDRDDDAYVKLGQNYPMVGEVGGGTCTLIDPRWVVTAAHVAHAISPFARTVTLDGKTHPIEAIAIHPAWRPDFQDPSSIDIALIKLARPVAAITPAKIYRGDQERNMQVTFVGRGMHGDGQTGPIAEDRRKRAATNIVEDIPAPAWLSFRFDSPDEGALDMEGISGPGDSGGPALIDIDATLYTIGVSSSNDSPPGDAHCTYGSTEYYTRLSTAATWIDKVMAGGAPAEDRPEIIDLSDAAWPDTNDGAIVSAFFRSYAAATDDAMRDFETAHRSRRALADRPVDQRVQAWRAFREQWGTITPLRYTTDNGRLTVLVKTERDGRKSFAFDILERPPHKLAGIFISPIE